MKILKINKKRPGIGHLKTRVFIKAEFLFSSQHDNLFPNEGWNILNFEFDVKTIRRFNLWYDNTSITADNLAVIGPPFKVKTGFEQLYGPFCLNLVPSWVALNGC